MILSRRLFRPALLIAFAALAATIAAQDRDESSEAQRIAARIRALQQEATRLAAQSNSLVGELQKLEVERQLRTAEVQQAEAARAAAERAVTDATARINTLDQQRQAQMPALEAQFVDLYKRGHGGYARLLFQGSNLRDFARASRAVSALASLNAKRVEEYRHTIDSLRGERAGLEQKARELAARDMDARRARAAAEQAIAARRSLAAQIDQRRDMTAQYVGELQVAYDRLQQKVPNEPTAQESSAVPLAPFRGALEWPVAGQLKARYGQTANRLGGAAVKNGIEIAAPEGTSVRAIHGGTVRFAENYTGFGTLVILDHGSENYSLYGYLSSASVARGDVVPGGAELGRVGAPPAGMPALYFELRIDGHSVDPLQWLKAR
jgi:septal ring factor EnvC (AmiA/AmiB activator)